MDDRTTENTLTLTKFGIGQPVQAQRRPDAGARRRPLHRRHQPAGPGLRGDGAEHRCPRRDSWRRHHGRQGHAGRARGADRRRSCRLWRAQVQPAAQESRRLADPLHAAAGARRRQGALRRRSGRLCDRGNRRAGQGRRRSGGARYRAVARGGQCARRREARRAAGLGRRAGQYCPRLSPRRHRESRRGLSPKPRMS